MSEGRKPVWTALWIQRLLSTFSRLDADSARATRDGCDGAGERELRWYGRKGFTARAHAQQWVPGEPRKNDILPHPPHR